MPGLDVRIRSTVIFWLPVALLTLLGSCAGVASKSRERIAQEDYAGAIELLAAELARKPGDKQALQLFDSVYPAHPERLLASLEDLGARAPGDPGAARRQVEVYAELARIQRAVLVMPDRVGDGTEIKKFEEDFPGLLARSRAIAAASYYAAADRVAPASNRQEKERLVALYRSVLEFDEDYRDTRQRGAELCYALGEERFGEGTIAGLEESVQWFEEVQAWIPGYRDSVIRLQSIRFELGTRLKAEGTLEAQERAYRHFKAAGSYRNAPAEVALFEFLGALRQLPNEVAGARGTRLRSAARAARSGLAVKPRKRTLDEPFVRRAAVQSESSAFSIFNPQSDVVHIGALIDGRSVADQTFRPLLVSRAPLEITIDLANLQGEVTTRVADPSRHSQAQQAVRRLVAQGVSASVPVRAQFRSVEIQSSAMLDFALGIGVGKGDITFGSRTRVETTEQRWSTLIELTQIYYTVNLDIPPTPAAFFCTEGEPVASVALLGSAVPYYVSSVTYGRRGYFLIESSATSREIQQQIEIAKGRLERVSPGTRFAIDTEIKKRLEDSKTSITSHVLGGSGEAAVITDIEGMLRWIHEGMDVGGNLGGAVPIGFVMRSLKDNGIAVVEQAGEIALPARARVTVSAHSLQFDSGRDPRALIRLYMSGGSMRPEDPGVDPNRTSDGAGWQVLINNGNNALPIGKNLGRKIPLEGRSYSTLVASRDETLYFAANLGHRMLVPPVNRWAGHQSTTLTVGDILQRGGEYRRLAVDGWAFSGRNFRGRYFFRFAVELLDD